MSYIYLAYWSVSQVKDELPGRKKGKKKKEKKPRKKRIDLTEICQALLLSN